MKQAIGKYIAFKTIKCHKENIMSTPILNNLNSNELLKSQTETLGKNLEYLILIKKIDVRSISDKTGISITNLNNIRRHSANPTLETLGTLANYFNLSVSDLIEKDISNAQNSKGYSLITIPLLEVDELNLLMESKITKEKIAISIPSHLRDMKRMAITLNNNSFSPIYEKDTLFILNLDLNPQDGDIVVLKLHDSPFMIRKILFSGNKISIFYPTLLDKSLSSEDKEKVHILGVIEKIIKER